ncbi:MAG: Rieske (2Fe-2S) protein [Planctomycetaceae bacterium]
MSTIADMEFLEVGHLDQLRSKGFIVITGADRPIAVFFHDGHVYAVDNRCPHLGFPLHQGSVKDGILTCHWHEARFDLCNGCTFDLFADDVPSYETHVRDGVVYVARTPRNPQDREYYTHRLQHGLRHSISLIQGKAILGLRKTNTKWNDVLCEIAAYGAANHDAWGEGMTILAIVGRLATYLTPETAFYTVLRAARQVAADCSNAVPHRLLDALADGQHSREQLIRWMRSWVQGRHRDGAERVLLTALSQCGPSADFAELVFTAASDRVYSQTGHVFDAANKAFELLDTIGWEHASTVLPLILDRMTMARGSEEDAHWHHPIEVIQPLRDAEARLPAHLKTGAGKTWNDNGLLLDVLLGDDPLAIIAALEGALLAGAPPLELSKRVTYAAALRLARFGKANELADWFNPRHTFIFANAVHQALSRSAAPGVCRGIFHAALSVYMDRFLNVPPARFPADAELESLPAGGDELCEQLLGALERHANVEEAAKLVARYIRLGHPFTPLIDTLTLATVREDLDFHAIQVLEAGLQQYHEWEGQAQAEHVLIAVVRQLAAFCPTPRAGHQLATIAMRLERGETMYEDADV